jgi:hypothetical protein
VNDANERYRVESKCNQEKELAEDSVIRKFRITAADGKIYETMHYNLDVVISVAERVRRGWRFAVVSLSRII